MGGFNFKLTSRSGAFCLLIVIAMLVAPVLGAVMYLRSDSNADTPRAKVPTPDVESPAKSGDWSQLVTSSVSGSPFAMADLTGKPTILYFWATWCPQCRVQRNVLTALSNELGDRLQIVALTVDDDVPSVVRYLKPHSSLSQELLASREMLRLFGVEGLPTLVLIDAQGRVQHVSSGLTDGPELRGFVKALLP